MGALEINPRKRDSSHTSFNRKFDSSISQDYSDAHVGKKPRFSPHTSNSTQDRRVSSTSTASRLLLYPQEITQLNRPVHAPCRGKKSNSSKAKGNVFRRIGGFINVRNWKACDNYFKTRDEAFSTLRFVGKGKVVIDVDDIEVMDTDCIGIGGGLCVEGAGDVQMEKQKKLLECDGEVRVLDKVVEEPKCQPSCSSVTSDGLVAGNSKVESADKALEMVMVNPEHNPYDGPLHEKLKRTADKRDWKLSMIGGLIQYCEKKLSILRLGFAKKPVKDKDELFVPLTDEEENEVSIALSNAKRRKVLVTHQESNIEITGEMLQCLGPGAWLNDEVINLYLVLLKEREQREPQKFLKCHFFNTFFYKKLMGGSKGYDYKAVRRWTTQRKLGYCLADCDKIFVPIHKEIHWCLAVINKKDKKFQYLDSLRGTDKQVTAVLARYFVDEVKDKSGKDIDVSSWEQEIVQDLPQQRNGYDCGVFMIKYSDFYSRDLGLCFNQEHMPYFRRRTATEILRLRAD